MATAQKKVRERLHEIKRKVADGQFADTRTKDDVTLLLSLVEELEKAVSPFARIATLPQEQNAPLVQCYKADCLNALKLIEFMDR